MMSILSLHADAASNFAQKPYDTAAFIKFLAHTIVEAQPLPGNWRQMLSALVRSEDALPFFHQLALGRLDLVHRDGVFFVGEMTKLTVEHQQHVTQRVAEISRLMLQDDPTVLVCALPADTYPPYAIHLAPGCGLIVISGQHLDDAVLRHELAHLMMCSGHYFLDEALAWYVESAEEGNQPNIVSDQPWNYSRALLISHITQLHEHNAEDVEHLLRLGQVLISTLVARFGIAKVLAFYRDFSTLVSGKTVKQALEDFFDFSLLTIEPIQPHTSNQTLVKQLSLQINHAYFSGKLDQLPTLVNELEHFELDSDAKSALARGYFALCFYSQQRDDYRLKLIDLVQYHSPAITAQNYVFALMHFTLKMQVVRSYLELQELAQHIEELFQQALTAYPDNAELHLMRGKSLAAAPQQHGGNPAQALVHFELAAADPVFGSWISELTKSYMEKTV